MKKYIKYSLVFLILGIVCGVFFREFSKAYHLTNVYLTLGLVHTHFLMLGVVFVLVIGLVSEKLAKQDSKLSKYSFTVYTAGVLGAGLMMFVRGILDVLVKSPDVAFTVSSAADGAISGITGLFHAVLGVSLILVFVSWLIKGKKTDSPE